MTEIFATRYQAQKERNNNSYFSSNDKIVKVCGGYTIMSPSEYTVWKNQK